MEKEFPYEACAGCLYRLATEDREKYGPRSMATINEEQACGEEECKLEGAVVLSSIQVLSNSNLYIYLYNIYLYMKQKNILHYPTLKTVLEVEKVLRNAELVLPKEEIKRRLPMKIMHQTLNLILDYLEERGMVLQGDKGVLWVWTPSDKLDKMIKEGLEV